MSNITPFSYEDHEVRVLDINGEPWFVLADLCKVLALSNPAVVAKRLDKADVCLTYISSGGQRRAMTIVAEPGLYDVVVRSDSPAAKPFRRWVTHEVLPAIRRTGAYATTPPAPQPQLSEDEIVHQALQITARRVEQLEADLAKALPKANTWDALCSGRGDHSITDAAKLLSSTGIATGPRKLHKQLQDLGWIHKNQRDKWAASQDKLNTGLLAEKVRHYIDDDGVSVLATPQVRVTPKGLEKLHELLTPAGLREVLA
jgi:BRO domain protein domain protein